MNITLKFYIKLQSNMSVNYLRVEESVLRKSELDNMHSPIEPNTIEGQITFNIVFETDPIVIKIEGVGQNPNRSLSFNFLCNDKKLFDQDQIILVESSGRFSFSKSGIKLPS